MRASSTSTLVKNAIGHTKVINLIEETYNCYYYAYTYIDCVDMHGSQDELQ